MVLSWQGPCPHVCRGLALGDCQRVLRTTARIRAQARFAWRHVLLATPLWLAQGRRRFSPAIGLASLWGRPLSASPHLALLWLCQSHIAALAALAQPPASPASWIAQRVGLSRVTLHSSLALALAPSQGGFLHASRKDAFRDCPRGLNSRSLGARTSPQGGLAWWAAPMVTMARLPLSPAHLQAKPLASSHLACRCCVQTSMKMGSLTTIAEGSALGSGAM